MQKFNCSLARAGFFLSFLSPASSSPGNRVYWEIQATRLYLKAVGRLVYIVILFSFTVPAHAQAPCWAILRWDGGSTWNFDGTINDNDNAPEPNGIVRCGSAVDTQSQLIPKDGYTYDPADLLIDVSSLTCLDPSIGQPVFPVNPTEGQPLIWLNFDVRSLAGAFQIQLNDSSGDHIAWALYYSNEPTKGTDSCLGGEEISGNPSSLTLSACGEESNNTWSSIAAPVFSEPTNYYLAIWDQDADGDLNLENFKARFGCGDALNCVADDLPLGAGTLPTGAYRAVYTLSTANMVSAGDSVTLTAGDSILFLPGFHAEVDSSFTARIEFCD